MGIETPEVQVNRLLEFLRTPVGVFFALAFLFVTMAMAFSKRGKWGLISSLLLFSPMMVVVGTGVRLPPLVSPFQQFRTYGRPISGALLLVMLIPTIMSDRGWRRKPILFAAFGYLLFELVFSARNVAGGQPLRGLVASIIFLLTFIVLGIGLPRWLQDLGDVRAVLRAIAVSALLFVLMTVIQLAVNRTAVIWVGRLFGLTGNAQHLATLLAVAFPPMAFLAVWKDEIKILRIVWAITAAVMVVLLLWTGSRTGAMVTIVGLGLLFRRNIGRFFGLTLVCAVLVLIGLQLTQVDVSETSTRMMSLANTRSGVWSTMFRDFLSSPMVGVAEKESLGGSENSYLLTAAHVGMMGLLPLLVMMGATVIAAIHLHGKRRALPEQSLLVDLVIAGLAALFVGAFFEGYLMGTLTYPVFMIYIYFALMGYLFDAAAVQAAFIPASLHEVETEGLGLGHPLGQEPAPI